MITSAVYPSTLSIRGYIENWSGVSLPTSTIESAVVEKGWKRMKTCDVEEEGSNANVLARAE